MLKIFFLISVLYLSFYSLSQEKIVLDLNKSIDLAISNSYLLVSDSANIVASQYRADVLSVNAVPQVKGIVATEQRFLQPDGFNSTWAVAQVEWSLGDYLKKTGLSAMLETESLEYKKQQSELTITGQVAALYLRALQAKKEQEIVSSQIQYLKKHAQVTEAMWRSGIKTRLDLIQTQSEILQLKQDSVSVMIRYNKIVNELQRRLNLQGVTVTLKPLNSRNIPELPPVPKGEDVLVDNPLLAGKESAIKAQQQRSVEVMAGKIPKVTAGGGYYLFSSGAQDHNYAGVNAGVVIPLYTGKEFEKRKHEVEAIIVALEADKNRITRALMTELSATYENMVRYKEILLLQKQQMELSQQAVKLAEANYKSGIASNLDWLLVRKQFVKNELLQSQTQLLYIENMIVYYIITNRVDKIRML